MSNRFRRIAVLAAVVIVAAGGGTAYAAMSGSGPDYRLATVTSASVTATLQVTGTVTPVREADVPFTVSGTVQSVKVTAGQHVTAGQALGTLDTTALTASLTQAQSALARADLQVDNDMSSQDAAAGGSGGTSGPAASSPQPSLKPLQQAVLSGQRAADAALAKARAAVSQAQQACAAPAAPAAHPSSSPPAQPGPVSGPTGGPSPAPSPQPTAPGSSACLAATQQAVGAETAVLQAEKALSGKLTALAQALSKAAADPAGGGTGGADTGGSGSADGGETAAGGTGSRSPGGGSGSGTVTAAQLAAAQAAADAAAAQVTLARANLASATAVSPVTGTVVAVSVTPGASASAGTTAFTIAGLDGYEVDADVPVTDLPQLSDGDKVSVQADGAPRPISGVVTAIGLMPDSTTSPVTYPVTISLTGSVPALHSGVLAGVTITTARGHGVTVPTSALHYAGRKATVLVDAGGTVRKVSVTVGTKGEALTEVTAGLHPGEKVVLANLNAPLPSD
jgi:multidrug efflux pump subunit AcrA (membrane-fusion protein)